MSAEEMLKRHEDNFTWVKKRYFFLKAFIEVIDSRTKKVPYEKANDTVSQMVNDCYDMLAIDLASLCRGMVGPGGFFNNLGSSDFLVPREGVIPTCRSKTG